MLDFAIFAVTFVVALIVAIIWLYPSQNSNTTIPGLAPTTKEDGNLADIERAGSLHEFLMELHQDHGAIATFWMGSRLVVSIASPELFKEHQAVFDRPPELFKLFEPLISPTSIQYANGAEGRARRQAYDKCFAYDKLTYSYPVFQKVAEDLCKKWASLSGPDNHIPLSEYMFSLTIKAGLQVMLGEMFRDDSQILELKTSYDLCWSEMEHRLVDPTIPSEDSVRGKVFRENEQKLMKMMKKVVDARRKHGAKASDYLLVDAILDYSENPDQVEHDCLTYLIGSFHTTGNLLTWALYFLATHQDVQEKAVKEICSVLDKDDTVNPGTIKDLKYLQQILDETLRCAVVAPWAARFQDFDSELGGHKIPKGTPVIHALGVVLQDEKIWPEPNKFDPDRFSPENVKQRPPMAFSPFGFAGKRKCPGYQVAYVEATIVMVSVLRRFHVNLVEGQVVTPVHGLVTHPQEEVWVTVTKRDK